MLKGHGKHKPKCDIASCQILTNQKYFDKLELQLEATQKLHLETNSNAIGGSNIKMTRSRSNSWHERLNKNQNIIIGTLNNLRRKSSLSLKPKLSKNLNYYNQDMVNPHDLTFRYSCHPLTVGVQHQMKRSKTSLFSYWIPGYNDSSFGFSRK